MASADISLPPSLYSEASSPFPDPMRRAPLQLIRYLVGTRANPSKGAESLVDSVLGASLHVNLPVSQQYLNERTARKSSPLVLDGSNRNRPLTDKHQHMVLRVGGAKILSKSSHAYLPNSDNANPVFYSKTSLRDAGLCASLTAQLRRLRIYTLTELQGALIPLLIKGQHVIAHAETGTGKSFGVALAVANRIQRDSISYRLHTIIFTPTEELALQYDRWLKHFGGCASQICQPAIPSIPLAIQLAKLHNIQPHVLVGTPQRIADIAAASPHLFGEKLRRKVDTIILDEADLILDGEVRFKDAVLTGADLVDRLYRSQTNEVPAQIVAASATIDGATAQRINAWMRNDSVVRISTSFVEHTIPQSITFYFFAGSAVRRTEPHCVPNEALLNKLLTLIYKHHQNPKILIFTSHPVADVCEAVNSKRAEILGKARDKARFSKFLPEEAPFAFAAPLATKSAGGSDPSTVSDRPVKYNQIVARNRAVYVRDDENVSKLCDGRLAIGVGSYDISRGLHVTDVSHVIIFGEAPPASEFVHCAGRTGRMQSEGEVICIFPPSSGRAIQDVCQSLELPFKLTKESAVDALLKMEDFFEAAKAQEDATILRHDAIVNDRLKSLGILEQVRDQFAMETESSPPDSVDQARVFEKILEEQHDDLSLSMSAHARAQQMDEMMFPE